MIQILAVNRQFMILGVTSAPDVREVDEFQEELSAAEKQKRRIQDKLVNGKPVPKDKLNLSVRKNEQVFEKTTNCIFWIQVYIF